MVQINKDIQTKFCQAFLRSSPRTVYYYVVVYMSVLCGISSTTQTTPTQIGCLAISALFLPSLFVYSMLFELSTADLFPAYLKGERSAGHFFWGDYWPLGWGGGLMLCLFLWAVLVCARESYVPLNYLAVPTILPFALTGFLYASKYQHLRRTRSRPDGAADQAWLLGMPLLLIALALYFVIMFVIALAGLRSREMQEPVYYLLMILIVLLVLVVVSIFAGELLDRRRPTTARFLHETLLVRETVAILSMVILPFLTGVYGTLAAHGVDIKPWAFLEWVLCRPRYTSVMLGMYGFALVVELMRYLGRYDESYKARKLAALHAEPEAVSAAFLESVQRYMVIFVVVLSLCPLLYFFGGFTADLNTAMTVTVLLLIFAVTHIARPYAEMGFSVDPGGGLGSLQWKRVLGVVRVPALITFLSVLHVGYQHWQVAPLFLTHNSGNDGIQATIRGTTLSYPSAESYLLFTEAAESGDYRVKQSALMGTGPFVGLSVAGLHSGLCQALRISKEQCTPYEAGGNLANHVVPEPIGATDLMDANW
ncbi:MAG: hypothetical protein ABIH46_06485, partial [Chloroflexota bacterium]